VVTADEDINRYGTSNRSYQRWFAITTTNLRQ